VAKNHTKQRGWRRGWESNPLPRLKRGNLLILRYARNAENARNPERGYAAVTRGTDISFGKTFR
jgi:hypothetical protein